MLQVQGGKRGNKNVGINGGREIIAIESLEEFQEVSVGICISNVEM